MNQGIVPPDGDAILRTGYHLKGRFQFPGKINLVSVYFRNAKQLPFIKTANEFHAEIQVGVNSVFPGKAPQVIHGMRRNDMMRIMKKADPALTSVAKVMFPFLDQVNAAVIHIRPEHHNVVQNGSYAQQTWDNCVFFIENTEKTYPFHVFGQFCFL